MLGTRADITRTAPRGRVGWRWWPWQAQSPALSFYRTYGRKAAYDSSIPLHPHPPLWAAHAVHEPRSTDHGAPLHEAQAEDEVIDQYDPIAKAQPVQPSPRQWKLLVGRQQPYASPGHTDLQLEK